MTQVTTILAYLSSYLLDTTLGAPHRKVVCLVGDGGLMSVLGALANGVELDAPVTWILFNNFCFSTIRTVGSTYFNNTYGTMFTRPVGSP